MKFETRELPARKRIAMVAHDHKKDDIIEWAYFNRDMLAKHELFATGTTGRLLEEKLDRPVRKLMSGPLGGDQQIGAMISNGEIDMLIFFWYRWKRSRMIPTLKHCFAWQPYGTYPWLQTAAPPTFCSPAR